MENTYRNWEEHQERLLFSLVVKHDPVRRGDGKMLSNNELWNPIFEDFKAELGEANAEQERADANEAKTAQEELHKWMEQGPKSSRGYKPAAIKVKRAGLRCRVHFTLRHLQASGPSLPATAQVARHQGEFLADLFSRTKIEPGCEILEDMKTFQYSHKGSLAYVGTDKPVMDLPVIGPLWGFGAGLVWKSFETYSQISSRNQLLVALDWLGMKLFGRDISRV